MPDIPVLEIVRAARFKSDNTLDYGNVEYDYLKEYK